jgi:co-chaperonin GroES (HSP10)
MQVILNRILVRLEDVKKEHKVEGTDIVIPIHYGELEERLRASVTQGEVISVGPKAFSDWGYEYDKPVKVGDIVQFAKYSTAGVFDESRPHDRLAVINDEDVIVIIKSKENTNE